MKRKWAKRGRGAISVFLIIIFVAHYLLCGVLVDSARHKIAGAMAESALDSASTSVLSYYNQLLYDLYGLMATDSLSQAQIQEKVTSYVERTLGVVAPDNVSVVETITDLMGAAFASTGGFDGYDFQTTVTANPTVSLANTGFAEYQLVEHMKYRAPVLLLDSSTGLLSKLKDLNTIKDRMDMVKDKLSLSKSTGQTANAENVNNTMKDIDAFIQTVRAYVEDPAGWSEGTLSTGTGVPTPKDLTKYVEPIDEAAKDAAEKYLKEWTDYRDDLDDYEDDLDDYNEAVAAYTGTGPAPTAPTAPTEPDVWSQDDWKTELKPGTEKALKNFKKARENAKILNEKAAQLLSDMNNEVASYQNYIGQLQTKLDAAADKENAKTVYGPEIELAKSNAGQLLKNRPFLTYVKTFTGEIADIDNAITNDANIAAIMGGSGTIPGTMANDLKWHMEDVEGETGSDTLPDPIVSKTAVELMNDPSVDLSWLKLGLQYLANVIGEDAISGLAKAQIDVKVDGEKAKKEAEKENKVEDDTTKLKDLKEADLKVDYEASAPSGDDLGSLEISGDVTAEKGGEMLNAAGGVLDKLMGLLEELRDDVYVNQYIVYYFPNYVDCYTLASKTHSENADKFLTGDYKDYCATQAEVEYVLTGDPDTSASVLKVQAMLLGIRTAFNMVAIFTDSAKVAQANAIAAVAGPFAPAVAIALLIAWAVAESVLDVADLCKGEEVPLFKQGADWKLSVEGAVSTAVNEAIDAVVDYGTDLLKSKVESMVNQVGSAADQAIYAAYNSSSAALNGCLDAAKTAVDGWNGNLKTALAGVEGGGDLAGAMDEAVEAFKGKLNVPASALEDKLSDTKDKAIRRLNKASEDFKKKADEKITNLGNRFTDAAAEKVGGLLKDKLPIGDPGSVAGAASKGPGLTYMDYIQLFLLLENQEKKVQRIQSLVQANIRHKAGNESFSMAGSYGAVSAKLDGSIKFLFMGELIVPESLRQDGRLKITANSSVSY